MRYQDLTIDLRSSEEGGFKARVAGQETPVPFPMPVERTALKRVLAALDKQASPKRRAATRAPDLRALGETLYQSLFRDGLAERFEERRGKGSSGVRIRLRFDFNDAEAEYLAAVPWELLRNGEFLAADPRTPVVRDVVRAKRRGPIAVEPPLRILLLGAAAPGTEEEQVVVRERDRIARSLKPLVDEGQVHLVELKSLSLDNLRDALLSRNEPVHILHFIGHGGYDPASGFGAVFFVGPYGRSHPVSGETFADHLKGIPWLRLVVLNSCETARYKGRAAAVHFGVAAALLERTEVQAVVAQQRAISFDAAVRFSDVFYRRIAAGDEVDVAITDMRLRLRPESDEWATPVLFLSSRNGKLFDFDPAERPLTRPVSDGEPVRLGVRSIDGWGKDMEDRNDKLLDLTEYFDGRYIKEQPSWQKEVFPRLRRFLETNAVESRPLVLDFAAHSSIAFAAGWVLEAKSGLDVRVRQRTGEVGEFEWHPKDHEEHPVPEGPLWLDEPDVELSTKRPDIAVALAVSQPGVADHVETYVRRKKLRVGRILRATIAPEPGPRSVAGGAHSLLLAQALVSRIRQRRPHERNGTCHLFCAAPNALLFYLGQLSRSFGRIVLYEHPFGAPDAFGKYQPSIELVVPGPKGDGW